MMKFFKFIISMISVVFYSAYADDYSFYKKEASSNYIFFDDQYITFGIGSNISTVNIMDVANGKKRSCHIDNWKINAQPMINALSKLTSDKNAILIYGTNSFLLTQELMVCKNGTVSLHPVPTPSSDVDTVVDIDFDKKIYLSISVVDAQSQEYSARLTGFNSNDDLINAGVFHSSEQGETFYLPMKNILDGSISLDGRYVFPDSMDCFENSPSGVWDIKEKKKVIFPSESNSDDEIADKCQKLFEGKASLKDLGGKLVLPTK
ncbi:hypothetical protein ACK1QP_004596 [Salmonella enterica]|nr:hypothetical protein [Salmonella enterica subsp. enterica serovar Oranienburg]EEJ8591694.1 hypothetical protein [Salmonella enterica subsp. enterica]